MAVVREENSVFVRTDSLVVIEDQLRLRSLYDMSRNERLPVGD